MSSNVPGAGDPTATPTDVRADPLATESSLASPRSKRVSKRWPLVSASAAVVLAVALGVIIAFRPTEPFAIDAEWMDEIIEHRSPVWEMPALVMNSLGGGILGTYIVPVLIIVVLVLFRRRWAAVYYLVAALASVGVVQLVKELVGRARPEDMLVTSDYGSFPSGHSANAATTALALAIVFPRLWVWLVGALYTVAMMLSRTYLGAHWLSDTIGGVLIGLGVAAIVWAPFAARLDEEGRLAHPPLWSRLPA